MNWRDNANCLGLPCTPFIEEHPLMLLACNLCQVKTQCLNYAMQIPADDLPGIYGGTTSQQRRDLQPQTLKNNQPQPINHGSIYAYRIRKCRCQPCKTAYAETRKRQRNAPRNTSSHPNT